MDSPIIHSHILKKLNRNAFYFSGKCDNRGILLGSNAAIMSVDFDIGVSIINLTQDYEVKLNGNQNKWNNVKIQEKTQGRTFKQLASFIHCKYPLFIINNINFKLCSTGAKLYYLRPWKMIILYAVSTNTADR